MIKYSKLFVRKTAGQIKLLVIYCYVVGWILEKTILEELFLVTLLVYCFEFMFGNFSRIFFQVALVGCFFKEKMFKKQERVVQLLHLRNYTHFL